MLNPITWSGILSCDFFIDASSAFPQRNQENGALAFRMRREEAHDIIVIECETRCSQPLRIRREIQLAAENACFQLNRAIPAVSIALEDFAKIGEKEHSHAGIGRQLLFQSKIAGNIS